MSSNAWILGGLMGAAAAGTLAHGLFVPQSRLFGPVISRGATEGPPRVALTFDDGPHTTATPAVLDILRHYNVKAAFFTIGLNMAAYPWVVQRVHEEGHLIGNHSFDHHRMGSMRGRPYWQNQLVRTNDLVQTLVGQRPRLFRPPMGIKTPRMMWACGGCSMRVVTWTRRGLDGVPNPPERILRRFDRCGAGDILVLHDGAEPGRTRDASVTLKVLPELIENIRRGGLEFERLDRLIGLPAYENA